MPNDDLPAVLGGTPIRPQGPPGWPPDDPAIVEVRQRAAADGSWGHYHGPHSEALAESLAALHGFDHVRLCASGTVAGELALRGLKIGSGDEVILAAYDFRGNMQDVLCVGATPVLVDIRPENWNLDVDRIEEAMTAATRAVLGSHLHGGQGDMPALRDLADGDGRYLLNLAEELFALPPLPLLDPAALADWLSGYAGTPLELKPDLDQGPALAAERDAQWARVANADFLTAAEKRALLGLPAVPEGDLDG